MAELADLKAFDIGEATVSVWVFKTSTNDGIPKFTGHWIGTTDALDDAVKEAVVGSLDGISETIEYDILVQNNEGSALTIMTDETYAHLIAAQVVNETLAKKVTKLKELRNSKFYAIKFVGEEGTMLAVRRADQSWSSRKSGGIIKVVYSDDELDLDENPTFNIEPYFDFFIFDDRIFISSKKSFETVLAYKAGHVEAFVELQNENEFAAVFADMGPIAEFVGANKMHLRRALAIREKGHYKDAAFMGNLRQHAVAMNLHIDFDETGRIVPTAESCRHIFQALLDHRLDSRLSAQMYDVQNTEPVS
ncbi:Kiwa anti-phage protein KwaB-like domain-containing protein [Sphingobium sp. AN558]|uniref:Kiwa anti-phage protein KwaB-like domain-containing protein n=1 Tax=Sphingobium sp. AN558 TaxID=3133442 RepID=UPI0030C63F58